MSDSSRVKNSINNISFGLLAQVSQMILGFVTRTLFIKYLSIEYLGVNGLFTSILTMLSFTELGVGSAILFALYKPLADNDEQKIAALVNFSKKVYYTIAGIILALGLLLLPFLDLLVKNPPAQIQEELSIIYLVFLFNTVSTYFFYYKLSLFQANQKIYIISKRNIVIFLIQTILQIASLILYQSFIIYIIINAMVQLGGNLYLTLLIKKHFPFLKKYKNALVADKVRTRIYSDVKSTAIVKVGGLMVNNSSNIILNYFSGLVMVGLLANYNLLIGLVTGLITQIFTGVKASVANVNAKESLQKKNEIFDIMNFANFLFYGVASVLIIVLINDFIILWIGNEFILPLNVIIAMVINFYILGMQNAVWTYKSTFGFFKEGRLLVLLTAALTLILGFGLGSEFGLLGILWATILARLLTNVWYDPYIVFKKGLSKNVLKYFIEYFKYILVLIISVLLIDQMFVYITLDGILKLVLKTLVAIIITSIVIFIEFRNKKEFIYFKSMGYNLLKSRGLLK